MMDLSSLYAFKCIQSFVFFQALNRIVNKTDIRAHINMYQRVMIIHLYVMFSFIRRLRMTQGLDVFDLLKQNFFVFIGGQVR